MQRCAATSGIPDALLSCHRYDEILPPGATQSCHLNGSGLERQIQRSATVWRLRSEQQAVRCGLFECKSVSRARGVANAGLSDEADSQPEDFGVYHRADRFDSVGQLEILLALRIVQELG